MSSREKVALWNDGAPGSAITERLDDFEEALAEGTALREKRKRMPQDEGDSLGSDSNSRPERVKRMLFSRLAD